MAGPHKNSTCYKSKHVTFLSVDILLQQTNFVGRKGLKKNKRAPACWGSDCTSMLQQVLQFFGLHSRIAFIFQTLWFIEITCFQILRGNSSIMFHCKKGTDFGVVHYKMKLRHASIFFQSEIKPHYKKHGDKYHGYYKLPGHRVTMCQKILRAMFVSFSGVDRPVIL